MTYKNKTMVIVCDYFNHSFLFWKSSKIGWEKNLKDSTRFSNDEMEASTSIDNSWRYMSINEIPMMDILFL